MKTTIGKRRTATIIAVIAAVGVLLTAQYYRSYDVRAAAWCPDAPFADAPQESASEKDTVDLAGRLAAISDRAGGDVGIAIIHVETNRTVAVQGARQLPLYSVFKLPLAIAVLKDVEANRLRLDRKVRVKPADVGPGWVANIELWRRPVDRSVAQLIELSIIRSDNTSSDKLLQLVGGPVALTQRMRTLGFPDIAIISTVREFSANRERANTGSAEDLARLLVQLQKGELLQRAQQTLLLSFMHRAKTGMNRLRGNLPAGTLVADKTGTGEAGIATNDVGIITLPKQQGHLAIAVLLSRSKLTTEAQEKLIAEIARTAYDAFASRNLR